MHIPRVRHSQVRGAFHKLKVVYSQKKIAAKKTIPGMLLIAQSITTPIQAPVSARIARLKPEIVADVFEQTNPEFIRIRSMIQRVVPEISDEFVEQVIETAERVKCEPDDLVALLYKESKLKPTSKNGQFYGLGQMNKKSLKLSINHANTDESNQKGIKNIVIEKFLKLPREEQMPYIRNYILAMKSAYIRNMNKHLSGGELYGLFYTPGRINSKFLSSANDHATAKLYKNNKALDFNKDSKITKQDLQRILDNIKAKELNINIAKK